jgi:DnaK suppressor protein
MAVKKNKKLVTKKTTVKKVSKPLPKKKPAPKPIKKTVKNTSKKVVAKKKSVLKKPIKKLVKKLSKPVKKPVTKIAKPAKTTQKKQAPAKKIEIKNNIKENIVISKKPIISQPAKNKQKIIEQTLNLKPKLKKAEQVFKKRIIRMAGKKVELPKGYKPSEKEEYMNENQLEYFRRKLIDWKKELLSESTETLDHLQNESWNEPDPSDQATIVEQTGLELRTRDRYRKLISKIDSALKRIEEGEYGYCEVTGDPIGIARLEARPIATMTIAAQEQHEMEEKMTLED